jgi:hypothetical protein
MVVSNTSPLMAFTILQSQLLDLLHSLVDLPLDNEKYSSRFHINLSASSDSVLRVPNLIDTVKDRCTIEILGTEHRHVSSMRAATRCADTASTHKFVCDQGTDYSFINIVMCCYHRL